MCGRTTLTLPDLAPLLEALEAEASPGEAAAYRPRWNGAPGDLLLVARREEGATRLSRLRWGLPGREGLLINARVESVGRLPSFREALQARRCVLPVDGFYEWTGAKGSRRPLRFHRPDGGLLLLAGLWTPAPQDPSGGAFAVLTCPADARVAPVHDRMPLLLPRARVRDWLAPGPPPDDLLAPPGDSGLLADEASSRVNDVRNEGPDLLAPDAGAKQLTLL